MKQTSRIFVAGHRGLVGSAISRHLQDQGYANIITRNHAELDLTNRDAVNDFFAKEKPEYVFLAAAKVGGILANNTWPADFIRDNLFIQTHVIDAAYQYGVQRLLFLGSSCIYPRMSPQPIREEYLMTGALEPTNSPYAVAKISGIEMCDAYNRQYGTRFISVMPTNLYGPGDNFNLETSHVLPALIRKFHLAKLAYEKDFNAIEADEARFGPIPEDIRAAIHPSSESESPKVILWGTGRPRREFLYVDDLADACLHLMTNHNATELLNIGTGKDHTIRKLAEMVQRIVGFEGEVIYDESKPDGTPQKLLDVSKLNALGWQAKTDLEEGIRRTYQWYRYSEK